MEWVKVSQIRYGYVSFSSSRCCPFGAIHKQCNFKERKDRGIEGGQVNLIKSSRWALHEIFYLLKEWNGDEKRVKGLVTLTSRPPSNKTISYNGWMNSCLPRWIKGTVRREISSHKR